VTNKTFVAGKEMDMAILEKVFASAWGISPVKFQEFKGELHYRVDSDTARHYAGLWRVAKYSTDPAACHLVKLEMLDLGCWFDIYARTESRYNVSLFWGASAYPERTSQGEGLTEMEAFCRAALNEMEARK
jgi:hypothetical protein